MVPSRASWLSSVPVFSWGEATEGPGLSRACKDRPDVHYEGAEAGTATPVRLMRAVLYASPSWKAPSKPCWPGWPLGAEVGAVSRSGPGERKPRPRQERTCVAAGQARGLHAVLSRTGLLMKGRVTVVFAPKANRVSSGSPRGGSLVWALADERECWRVPAGRACSWLLQLGPVLPGASGPEMEAVLSLGQEEGRSPASFPACGQGGESLLGLCRRAWWALAGSRGLHSGHAGELLSPSSLGSPCLFSVWPITSRSACS